MTHDIIATRVIAMLHQAESHLVGRPVVTFNGKTGICKGVRLDDNHGLCFTCDEQHGHRWHGGKPELRWYPVSTIRMKS